ncbi:MAG: sigma-70 family RNA polymerase sigma factor [Planctomycetota bacterium]
MERFEWEPTIEDLRWLERLALALVGDVHDARDLAQSALIAATQGAPTAPEERRRWLFGTVRNLAAKSRRSRRRRIGYEAEGARAEALPSPEELAVRAEDQQRLLRIVRSLDERYRTPLLLRYYEDASPTVIAAQLDLPVRTVHTRLHRGLQLLRERLDAEHPCGREGWMAALLPLGPPDAKVTAARSTASPGLGAGLVGATACAALVAWIAIAAMRTDAVDAERIERAAMPPVVVNELDLADVPARREGTDADRDIAAPDARPVEIQVLDWEGLPQVAAQIVRRRLDAIEFEARSAVPDRLVLGPEAVDDARTDAGGIARVLAPNEESVFAARAAGRVTAVAAVWRPGEADRTPVVMMAPARSLAVRLVDVEGRAVSDVRAWVVLGEESSDRLPFGLDRAHALDWPCGYEGDLLTADELPDVDGAELVLQVEGGPTRRWPLEQVGDEIVWAPMGDLIVEGALVGGSGASIQGRVVDDRGHVASTAADGSFSIAVERSAPDLWAVAVGREPVRLEVPVPASTTAIRVDVGPIQVESFAQVLRGRVLDELGRGLPATRVLIEDPTICGDAIAGVQLESLAAGGSGAVSLGRSDQEGRFEVEGLRRDRAYRLRLFDDRTALWIVTPPLAADREHDVVLRVGSLRSEFSGRVVDDLGRPLAGASVSVWGLGYGQRTWRPSTYGDRAEADRDGRFVLRDVPPTGVSFFVDHPGVRSQVIPAEAWPEGETKSLARAARLRIRLVDAASASTATFENALGETVAVWRLVGLGRREVVSAAIVDGFTPVLEVGCDVVRIVLWDDGRVVRRAPLRLEPGRLNEATL